MECITKLFTIWMMFLKVGQKHADNLLREDPESETIAWIDGHTKIGPVLQVKTACSLDIYGIEIQIPSTSGDGSQFWVVVSIGSNRHAEELRYNDPDYSQESCELANHGSTEETRASQPKTQSNPKCDHSEDSIPIGERKWNDILACEKFKGTLWNPVMKLVRHLDQKDREIDGAVHWKSMGPKRREAFQKEGGRTFSDSEWFNYRRMAVPKACREQTAGGLARVPNLRVCEHLASGWHTQEGRANYRLAVVPSSRRGIVRAVRRTNAGGERPGCPQGSVVATWYGGRQSSFLPQQPAVIGGRSVRLGYGQGCKRSKFT